jgi:hypothetical protein
MSTNNEPSPEEMLMRVLRVAEMLLKNSARIADVGEDHNNEGLLTQKHEQGDLV